MAAGILSRLIGMGYRIVTFDQLESDESLTAYFARDARRSDLKNFIRHDKPIPHESVIPSWLANSGDELCVHDSNRTWCVSMPGSSLEDRVMYQADLKQGTGH
jgi:hypothetical protein